MASFEFTARRALYRNIFFCVGLVLVAAFNLTLPSHPTFEQVTYENWLLEKQKAFYDAATPSDQLPSISLDISSDPAQHWFIDPASNPKDRERVLRLLNLVREAKLFSLHDAAEPVSGRPTISVVIKDKERTFRSIFLKDDIAANTQAELMLKLFQIYASTDTVHRQTAMQGAPPQVP